jgi:8-oxo-dGTP pyrophosphatase MutT (NUDIX family)
MNVLAAIGILILFVGGIYLLGQFDPTGPGFWFFPLGLVLISLSIFITTTVLRTQKRH